MRQTIDERAAKFRDEKATLGREITAIDRLRIALDRRREALQQRHHALTGRAADLVKEAVHGPRRAPVEEAMCYVLPSGHLSAEEVAELDEIRSDGHVVVELSMFGHQVVERMELLVEALDTSRQEEARVIGDINRRLAAIFAPPAGAA